MCKLLTSYLLLWLFVLSAGYTKMKHKENECHIVGRYDGKVFWMEPLNERN